MNTWSTPMVLFTASCAYLGLCMLHAGYTTGMWLILGLFVTVNVGVAVWFLRHALNHRG